MRTLYTSKKGANFLIIEPQEASWVILDNNSLKELQNSATFQELSKKNPRQLKYIFSSLYEKNVNIKPHPQRIPQKLAWNPSCPSENIPHYFVLEVSSKCNLRCKYCEAASAFEEKLMDFKTIKIIIDKILALFFQHPATFLFHGGEPLLNFPIIKRAIRYIRTKAKNKKVRLFVQTNGTLLNQKMVDFFKKYKVNIGISIDGPEEIHNRNRVYSSGKGSFKETVRAINLLNKNKFPLFGTIAVVTNPKDLKDFYPFLIKNKIKHTKLNYYYRQGRAKDKIMSQKLQKEFAKEHIAFFKKTLEHNKNSSFKITLSNISLMLGNLLTKKRGYMCMRAPCGAGTSTLGIKVNGDIYPCDRMKDKKEFLIGNIKENRSLKEILTDSSIIKNLKKRTPENIPKCKTCAFRNFCYSCCTNNSYVHFNSLSRESDFCHYYKKMLEDLMWLSCEKKDEVYTYFNGYAQQ